MKKHALVAGLVLAASVTFAPLAFAQDTGPATTACTDAKAAVVGAQGRLDAAISSQDVKNVPAMKQQLEALKKDLPAKEKAVADAIAKDNAVVPPLTADSPETVAEKKNLATLQTQIKTLGDLIAKTEDNVVKLRGDVAAAVVVRDKACAAPVTPAPTTTPTPTTTAPMTVAPSTSTSTPPPAPSDGFSQVRVVPQGGVDTGTR